MDISSLMQMHRKLPELFTVLIYESLELQNFSELLNNILTSI